MIFVTVGTNGAPFDRLLQALDDVSPGEEVVVQRGPSPYSPAGARTVDYLPFSELSGLVGQARAVVTHAGAGSILVALSHGHRPVVVPRDPARGEVIDDHQLTFALRLDREGLVHCVTDVVLLRSLLAPAADFRSFESQPAVLSPLVEDLAGHLVHVVEATATPAASIVRRTVPATGPLLASQTTRSRSGRGRLGS